MLLFSCYSHRIIFIKNIFYRGYLRNQAKHLLQRFMCDRKGIGLIGRQRRVQTDIHAIPFRQISGQFINRLFLETQGFFCPKARDRNIRGFLFYAGNTFFTHKSRKTKSDGREKRKAIFEAKTKCAPKIRVALLSVRLSGQNTSVVQTPFESCLNDAFLLKFPLKYHLKLIANSAEIRIFT